MTTSNLDFYSKILILRVAIELGIFPNIFDTSPEILEKISEKNREIYEYLVDSIKKHQELCDFFKDNESKGVPPLVIEKFKILYDADDEATNKLGNVLNSIKKTLPAK